MRKNYRKRKFNRKRKSTYKVFFLILVAMTVGFAAINTTLQLIGTLNISRTTWNIHWENPTKVGGVTAIQEVHLKSGDDTTVEYQVKLNNPGDYYEFTVDAKNDGTIDGMITSISNKVYENNVEVTPTYLESTITYDDGTDIEINDILESGESEKYRVRVEYKQGLTPDQLPDSEKTYNYKFIITYMQADNNAKPTHPSNYGKALYFDPISSNKCDETTYDLNAINNNTSTCYKWREIDGDKNNLTVQLDHNITGIIAWDAAGRATNGPTTAYPALTTATTNWNRVPALTYEYDSSGSTISYGKLECDDGICNIVNNNTSTLLTGTTSVPVRARMVTGEEIKTIVLDAGVPDDSIANNWDISATNIHYYYIANKGYIIGTQTSGEDNDRLAWLVENTVANSSTYSTNNAYGSNNNGYWTISPAYSYNGTHQIWEIYYHIFSRGYAGLCDNLGVRPVIKMPRCVFDGRKCSGWQLINSEKQKWSYYQSNGEMIYSGWGRQIPDLSGSPRDYYFENGVPIKGWRIIDGNKYYFSEDDTDHNNYIDYNKVYGGTYNINGENYTFDNDGVCISSNCNE